MPESFSQIGIIEFKIPFTSQLLLFVSHFSPFLVIFDHLKTDHYARI